jgi:hypothetical protein
VSGFETKTTAYITVNKIMIKNQNKYDWRTNRKKEKEKESRVHLTLLDSTAVKKKTILPGKNGCRCATFFKFQVIIHVIK